MEEKAKPRLAAFGLFVLGFAYLYAASLHRFTPALQYSWVAGVEILHGRHPYRDYHFLIGPAVPYIQALFFKLLGVSYALGYVSHAALFNGLACAMTLAVVWLRTRRLDWAAAAGALPIVWFYAVFMATPWYDHEAHAFILASVLVLQWRKTDGWRAVAGALAAVSFFCKQSHGAFGLIFLCFYCLIAWGWRAAAAFTVGGTAGVLAGTAAMAGVVGWDNFWRGFVVVPLTSGRTAFTKLTSFRLLGAGFTALLAWRGGLKPMTLLALPLGFGLAGIAVQSSLYFVFLLPLLLWPWLESDEERALVLSLCLVSLWGRLTSNNEIKVFQPFLGVFFGALCAAIPRMRLRNEALAWRWTWSLWGLLMAWGLRVSYGHKIHDPFPGTKMLFAFFALALVWGLSVDKDKRWWFRGAAAVLTAASFVLQLRVHQTYNRNAADPEYMERFAATKPSRSIDVEGLRRVTMTEPDAAGLERLIPDLRALPESRKPFYAYLECDMLYSLAGQPLPAFWWYDPTSTFRPGDGTEDKLIEELRTKYKTFVWCPPYASVDGMPKLTQWINEHTTLEKAYGPYRLHEIHP
jgi:hypothetical protein